MSCTIIRPRERKTIIEFMKHFDITVDGGFAFDCDEHGNVFSDMPKEAEENYQWCLKHPEKLYRKPYIKRYRHSYTEPALAKCICGNEIYLQDEYMGACECQRCGRWYNIFGQELLKPEYWESDCDY